MQGMNTNYHDDNKHKMNQVDNDEKKLCEVAKHPFGIIILYVQAVVGVIGGIALSFYLLASLVEDGDNAYRMAVGIAILVILITVVMLILATIVYRQNRLVVTDRNITQTLQYGLFNRKVSQLNLVNVEDVTSIKNGLMSTIFGFGELKIETAGEQVNFHFTYCPRPGYFAKIILEAREQLLGQHDGDGTVPQNNMTIAR